MVNLERLVLNICVYDDELVDGNQLKNHWTNSLPRLKTFIFNIRSLFSTIDEPDLPSNEDIQCTFADLKADRVISYVDHVETHGQCHYFSYPYQCYFCDFITNQFPDGLFESVREVSLYDERPFEHEFFLRIGKMFPLLEILSLTNLTPQRQKSVNNKKDLPMVEYPHLTELNFNCAHDDYMEQFLMHTKTVYPNDIDFWGDYESLERVTRCFTRKSMRINCAKMKHLYFYDRCRSQISNRLQNYFPHAKI